MCAPGHHCSDRSGGAGWWRVERGAHVTRVRAHGCAEEVVLRSITRRFSHRDKVAMLAATHNDNLLPLATFSSARLLLRWVKCCLVAWVVFVGDDRRDGVVLRAAFADVAWTACAFRSAFSQLWCVRVFGSLRDASRWWCGDGAWRCCHAGAAMLAAFSPSAQDVLSAATY